jgi:predicted anti-sigma-YlaC factor YlaD
MKCNDAQKWLLLADEKKFSTALTAHLNQCPDCREFQQILIQSQTQFQATEEPPSTILNNVKREARLRAPTPQQRSTLRYWKPMLATAASMMIVLGLVLSNTHLDRVGLELVMSDADLFNTQDQVVSIMYNNLTDDDLAFDFLMSYEEGT